MRSLLEIIGMIALIWAAYLAFTKIRAALDDNHSIGE